jgi:hypothetical protein
MVIELIDDDSEASVRELERRVVEAALSAHHELSKSWLSKDSRLVRELTHATDALLTARATLPTQEDINP